jgi:phosphatidylserine/phosphatidylglycerophosphate/cardiolipin synthase-like enzyme
MKLIIYFMILVSFINNTFASFEEYETQPKTFSHLADDLVDKIFSFINDSKTRTSLLLVSKRTAHRAKRIKILNNDHAISSYNNNNKQGAKRPREQEGEKKGVLRPSKKLRGPEGNTVKVDHLKLTSIKQQSNAFVTRLTTYEGHISFLEKAFELAKHSILVTNYGDLYHSLVDTRLFQTLIPAARKRGVKIYFRYNYNDEKKDRKFDPIPLKIEKYFDEHRVDADDTSTHAKIIAVDKQFVAIGSFNWLTELTSSYRSTNSSIVYRGEEATPLIDHIWKVLVYYRNKQFMDFNYANYRRAYSFKRNPFNDDSFETVLDDQGSKLTYVPILEEHRRHVLDLFEKAKERIIILSPFIAKDPLSTYQRDFTRRLLSTVLQNNINVCFVCLPMHWNKLDTSLDALSKTYSNLKVISCENFHAKTIIVDNDIIAEGSFNWLSAVRDETDDYHNHEATLICEGVKATKFITDFNQTKLGQDIIKLFDDKKPCRGNLQGYTFFSERREELEREMWMNHPFWEEPYEGHFYFKYGIFIQIMSGEEYFREGYCVRIDGDDYIRDRARKIKYFKSIKEAKEAAYVIWKEYWDDDAD